MRSRRSRYRNPGPRRERGMRGSLFDMLVAAIIVAAVAVLLAFAVKKAMVPVGRAELIALQVFAGSLAYLALSSPLYRLLRLRPLLLPKCPLCNDPHRHYLSVSWVWPVELVQCCHCGGNTEMHTDKPGDPATRLDVPRADLLWPYSFGGRWRIGNLPRQGNSDSPAGE